MITFNVEAIWKGVYTKNPFTASSYYASTLERCFDIVNDSERSKAIKTKVAELIESGEEWLLPHRLGLLQGEKMISVNNSGRARAPMVAQMKGQYTQIEQSPYKQFKPYQIHTGLWKVAGNENLFYGSIGISNTYGGINKDNGDLLILRTNDWIRVEIFIFRGLVGIEGHLDYLPEATAFVNSIEIDKGGCFTTSPLNNLAYDRLC